MIAAAARNYRFCRDGHGWNNSYIARQIPVSRQTLSKISQIPTSAMSGVRTTTLRAIEKALDLPDGWVTLTTSTLGGLGVPIGTDDRLWRPEDAAQEIPRGTPRRPKSMALVLIAQGVAPDVAKRIVLDLDGLDA